MSFLSGIAALYFLYNLVEGLRTGEIAIKAQSANRERQPTLFWAVVIINSLLVLLSSIITIQLVLEK